jgi:hypothetical protein
MESFSSKLFLHNGKRTAIISTCYCHDNSFRRLELFVSPILQKRFDRNPTLDFKQIYASPPESQIFIDISGVDIVMFGTHLPDDDKCALIYKKIYEHIKDNMVATFTDVKTMLEQFPEALYTETETQIRAAEFEEMHQMMIPKLSPIYDCKPSEILPNLFLGSVEFANDPEFLREKKIGAIVTVMPEALQLIPENQDMRRHHISIPDAINVNIRDYKDDFFRFITACFEDGLNVYIHCKMGISRSTSFVIALLMKHRAMRFEDALTYVKARRPQVEPNFGFHCQLLAYEKDLFPN